MHQAVFADVVEAASCTKVPFVWKAMNHICVKRIEMGKCEKPAAKGDDAFVYRLLLPIQRPKLTRAIMQNAYRAVEPQSSCASRNLVRVIGTRNVCAED